MGQQLAKILYNQADKFLQQVTELLQLSMGVKLLTDVLDDVIKESNREITVLLFFFQLQTFEDLLKKEKLQPSEQMKVKATNSLSKSYF